MKRDWADARAKVEEEGECRVCGSSEHLEAAHIMGRKHDEPKGSVLYVRPERIVPLCGTFSKNECHAAFDAHRLELLIHLTCAEQARAVIDAGSITLAMKRLTTESE